MLHEQFLHPNDYTRWYSTSITDEGTSFALGSIIYGQSKDLLIPLSPKSVNNCEFTVTYDNVQEKKKSVGFNVKNNFQQADLNAITRHKFRLEFVDCVRTTLEKMREKKTKSTSNKNKQDEEAMKQIKTLEEEMKKYADKNDEYLKDLFVDLTGQVQQALEREDWFMKWGVHFLPSLTRKFAQINIR